MSRPKVFLTRRLLPGGMKMIEEACQADVWPAEVPPPHEEIVQRVKGVEGLVCLLTDPIDREVLEAAGSSLKVISACSVGVDNIDLKAATEHGIPVGNTPGVLTDATADLTFALLLAAARRVVEADRLVKKGEWKTWGPSIMLGADLKGTTLGIIGFGRIGRAVAHRAAGFGMRILFTEPGEAAPEPGLEAQRVDLEVLLRESDFISLHCPLTPQTRGLIDAAAFEKMKPTAVLVNTSRGPVVDTQALYDVLKAKRIFAAALDVTVPEPLPKDSPLLTLENCIVVPHIASASVHTRAKMSEMAAENLLAGVKGERLPNCVNPEVYR
jgi:lactate dehydrogenase-like 2-hydroxyacid dehydrogenase